MTVPSPRSVLTAAATAVFAALVFGVLFLAVVRLWPHRDPLPAQIARTDEKAAASVATAIGADVDQRNADATLHIDVTTKEIADAFAALPPPAPAPAAGSEPRPLPAAPVDRVRDRLNEGISRANRAAGPADPTG
jgi:hypothetical protein